MPKCLKTQVIKPEQSNPRVGSAEPYIYGVPSSEQAKFNNSDGLVLPVSICVICSVSSFCVRLSTHVQDTNVNKDAMIYSQMRIP